VIHAVAGESLEAGDLVFIGADGKIYCNLDNTIRRLRGRPDLPTITPAIPPASPSSPSSQVAAE
jgi:hypothetical protein